MWVFLLTQVCCKCIHGSHIRSNTPYRHMRYINLDTTKCRHFLQYLIGRSADLKTETVFDGLGRCFDNIMVFFQLINFLFYVGVHVYGNRNFTIFNVFLLTARPLRNVQLFPSSFTILSRIP